MRERKGTASLTSIVPRVLFSYSQTKVATTYVDLAESMTVGGAIMIDDGLIELQVTSIDEAAGAIKCVVVNGGLLGENKGVNLPAVVVNLPAVRRA